MLSPFDVGEGTFEPSRSLRRLHILCLAQSFPDALADLRLESGTVSKELLELFFREHHEFSVFVRDGALRMGAPEQKRVLAEELTRPRGGDLDLTAFMYVEDPHAAREHDEERLRLSPLFEDDAAGAPAEVAGGADELQQRPVVDLRKQRNAPQGNYEAVRDLNAHAAGRLS
jgi:hypothetical protein